MGAALTLPEDALPVTQVLPPLRWRNTITLLYVGHGSPYELAFCYTFLGIIMNADSKLKSLYWAGSAKADLKALPKAVTRTFGFALYIAQAGGRHPDAKPLRGFGSAGVLEVVEEWRGNTFRAVYTVQYSDAVFVLHAFQKKSKHGIETPKVDMELIKRRLRMAEQMALGWS